MKIMNESLKVNGSSEVNGTINGYDFSARFAIDVIDGRNYGGIEEFIVDGLDYDNDEDLIFDLMNEVAEAILNNNK